MYKKIPLNSITQDNLQLKSILQLPFIRESLEAGGTIAGGFVRHLLNNGNLYNYLSAPDYSKKIRTYSGDIDIFFEDETQIKHVISSKEQYAYLDCLRLVPSLTNICLNITYDTSSILCNKINGTLKIQLVSGFYGKAEDVMETFDFTNSRCAIDSQFVYYDKRFFDLEKNNELDIRSGNGPLTGYRILKYLNKRGLTSITNNSREAITEWSIRYGGKFWDDHPMSKVKGLSSKYTISSLIKDDRIFLTTDLLHLIGEVQIRQPIHSNGKIDSYSIVGWNESDLATDIIAQRSRGEV